MINKKTLYFSILISLFSIFNVCYLYSDNVYYIDSVVEEEAFATQATHIPNGPTILNDISRKMKTPGYWISKLSFPDRLILNQKEINDANSKLLQKGANLNDITNFKSKIGTKALKKQQDFIFKLFAGRKYIDSNFEPISKKFVKKVNNNIKIPSKDINVRHALTVNYTDVRLLPTDTVFLYDKITADIDRLQVASLDICEPIIALHQTKDKKWTYIISFVSEGWVKTSDIAFTSVQEFNSWLNLKDFVVVTKPKADVYLNQNMTEYFDYVRMSTKLPIIKTINNYVVCVKIPFKNNNGNLTFRNGYMYFSAINKGYLRYTQRNVLVQAFKHLNSPYSWGGYNGEQDCSTFIRQIFGCFGILLPRNSMAQINVGSKTTSLTKGISDKEKNKEIIKYATSAMSLLYLPGHIMLYIGTDNNKPYIIHAIWGTENNLDNKEKSVSFINRVVVSGLNIGENTTKGSLLQRITKVNILK